MTGMRKGLLLAAIQVLLVLSLGCKLLYDRVTRPRVWVLSQVYDPELPIRGRYLSQRLTMSAEGFTYKEFKQGNFSDWYENRYWAYLEVRSNQLVAKRQGSESGAWIHLHKNGDGSIAALMEQPVLIFIPERAEIPVLRTGQEMWVEVTVPAKGPPRPIRIGVKKDGVVTPLKFE